MMWGKKCVEHDIFHKADHYKVSIALQETEVKKLE